MVFVRWKDPALEGSRKTGLLFRGPVDWVERKRPLLEGLVLEVMRLKLEEEEVVVGKEVHCGS